MIRILPFLMTIALVAQATSSDSARVALIIQKALAESQLHELSDPQTIEDLRKVASGKMSPGNQLVVLGLLANSSATDRDRYAEKVLKDPAADRVLGQETVARLFRRRAEARYDAGDFTGAAKDFSEGASRTTGDAHEYFIVKEGWAWLLQKRGKEAFLLWRGEIEQKRATEAVWESLGQAFAEDRSREPLTWMARCRATSAEAAAFRRGVIEGLAELESPVDVKALAKATSGFLDFREFRDELFRSTDIVAIRGCDRLYWLDVGKAVPFPPHAIDVAAECAEHWVELAQVPSDLARALDDAFPQLEARGIGRRWRVDWLAYRGRNAEACSEAWSLFAESPVAIPDSAAALSTAIPACRKVTPQGRASLAMRVREAAIGGRLVTESDPLLAVVAALLESPEFLKGMEESSGEEPAFGKTLVPRLIAERLALQGKPEEARGLLARELSVRPATLARPGIWQNIALSLIKKNVKGAVVPADESSRLWDGLEQGEVSPQLRAPTLSLAARDSRWSFVARLLPGTPAELSPELFARLFFAVADGVLDARALPADRAWTAFGDLGLAVASPTVAAFAPISDLDGLGKGATARDLRELDSLGRRSQRLLSLRGSSESRLERWGNHLSREWKEISRYPWSEKRLARAASGVLSDFCGQVGERFRSDSFAKGLGAASSAILGALEARFEECRKSLAVQGEGA